MFLSVVSKNIADHCTICYIYLLYLLQKDFLWKALPCMTHEMPLKKNHLTLYLYYTTRRVIKLKIDFTLSKCSEYRLLSQPRIFHCLPQGSKGQTFQHRYCISWEFILLRISVSNVSNLYANFVVDVILLVFMGYAATKFNAVWPVPRKQVLSRPINMDSYILQIFNFGHYI